MSHPPFEIVPVRTPADLNDAIKLIRAYVDGLGVDLSFQDFDAEIALTPGKSPRSSSLSGTVILR
jgi:hypothetical protein